MTMSKRLALLGAQSAFSVAKPRGLGSCNGLINRRPFPHRQISDFTRDSNLSKNSEYHSSVVVQHETERLRRDIEMLRMEIRFDIEKSQNKLAMELLATKYDIILYGAGTLVSVSALGISVFRIMM